MLGHELKPLLKFLLIILVLPQIQAADADKLKLSLGGGYNVSTNIRQNCDLEGKSSQHVGTWVPVATLSWKMLTIRGPQVGLGLLQNAMISLSAKLSYFGHDYRSNGMFRRKRSFAFGGDLRLIFLRLSYLRDIEGRSHGSQYSFSIGHRLPMSKTLFINPSLGTEYFDQSYVDYYFGVRPEEATTTRTAYSAGGSWNNFVSLGLTWNFIKNFNFSVTTRYRHYGENISNSPTVRTSDEMSYMSSLSVEL
jgi:MipA family protein